ncbi:MAG TPA: substrate-binding domain-containing protein [Burkholderiales bacterium]|nr:substrate-binding domain-containing protein [Burkholderiales bacterium]
MKPTMVWQAGTRTLDARVLELLRALQHHATLKRAAEEVGVSYRGAWGLLVEAGELAGAPLAELRRGRGSRLTRLGAQLLKSDERLRQAVAPLSARFEVKPSEAVSAPPLRLAASHDPLLAEFCGRFAVPAGLVGEIAFRGSEESLALFSRGAVEAAGFHIEEGDLRRFLRVGRDVVVRFAAREQGLIVAQGNPKRLKNLGDVVRTHARFVNRQRGSGTRRHIDRLLRDAGINPENLRGYGTEEHTHLAVAATVASGRADAGFGVHAAAAQFGLDFVPALRETYWLALRERELATPTVQRLLDALAGKPLARIARKFTGYDLKDSGSTVAPEALFP